MLFHKLFFAFSSYLAVDASAFLVAVGKPDGLYEYYVDAAGREIHHRINVTVTNERSVSDIEA